MDRLLVVSDAEYLQSSEFHLEALGLGFESLIIDGRPKVRVSIFDGLGKGMICASNRQTEFILSYLEPGPEGMQLID